MKFALIISFIGVIILSACEESLEPMNPTTSQITQRSEQLINDQIGDLPVAVFSNQRTQSMAAYSRVFEGSTLQLEIDTTASQTTFIDQEDNKWNIFGEGISENNRGEKFKALNSIYGYWFSLVSIYDTIEIYNESTIIVNSDRTPDNQDWSIPTTNLVSTGPLDTYPSIDNPSYINAEELLRSSDGLQGVYDRSTLTTVIRIGGRSYIYPHNILNYHESVNDEFDGLHFTLSFCPLTQTSQVWNRSFINNGTLGISGILYNNNLVLYDRVNNDYWAQILQAPINVDATNNRPEILPYFEMTLNNALQLEGTKLILSTETGFNRDYDQDIYQSYKADQDIIYYRIFNEENQFFSQKEKVLGIVVSKGRIKVYPSDL